MPITIPQVSAARALASGQGAAATYTFGSTPSTGTGRYIVAVSSFGFNFGGQCTGFAVSDNQGNTYTQQVFASASTGQAVGISTAPITTASGSFIVSSDAIITTGADDGRSAVFCFEIAGADPANLIDIAYQIASVSYATDFDYVTGTLATASELIIAAATCRNQGTFNNATDPSGYTIAYRHIAGGFNSTFPAVCFYKITTTTASENPDLGGFPIDGTPVMVVLSIRGAAGTIYTWTPTAGGLLIAGGAPVAKTKNFLPTAGLALSGNPPRAKTKSFLPTGGLTKTGNPPHARTKAFNATGALVIAGAAVVTKAKAFLASAGLTISGNPLRSKTKAYLPTGGLTKSGTAPISKAKVFLPTSGLTISGNPPRARTKVYQAFGQITIAGAASTSNTGLLNKEYLGTGQLSLSGASLLAKTKNFLSTGTFNISGAVVRAKTKAFTATGGLTKTGSPPRARTKNFSPSGVYTIAGAATTLVQGGIQIRSYVGSGSFTKSGGALLSKTKNFAASGNLLIAGSAIKSKQKAWLTSGRLQIGGSAVLQKLRIYSPSGRLQIAGFASTALQRTVTSFEEALYAEASPRKWDAKEFKPQVYNAQQTKRAWVAKSFKKK